jgi:hypothetical protein
MPAPEGNSGSPPAVPVELGTGLSRRRPRVRVPSLPLRFIPARERRETLRDKLRRKLEEHTDEVVAAYLAGIRSDDPNRAYRAADAWISRMHGRPKESVDNVAVPHDGLDVAAMTIEERKRLKREILRQHPHLAEQLRQAIAAD